MKNISIIAFLFFSQFIFSQAGSVGINTANPTRTLHVNGNLKVSSMNNASEDGAYDRVLIADDDGNIDYINKKDFLPDPGIGYSDKESYSSIYNRDNGSGDATKSVKCGRFSFTFDNTSRSEIKFYLNEAPTSNVSIYMNMEQNWNGGGFQFYQGTATDNTSAFVFTPSNYATPRSFASANVADYEQNVMHFQYPGEAFIYRLTIYRVSHTSSNYDFVAACEKF